MKHEIVTNWAHGMSFNTNMFDHKLVVDADEKFGGNNDGPRPKPLLLFSLAGCTGMDVVSLFSKMRVPFEDLKIRVSGELTDEHPIYYNKIHLVYELYGKDFDKGKVEKAINLSQNKYCGVSYMLRQSAEITFEIQYL